MKVFKENPVFATLVTVLVVAAIAGASVAVLDVIRMKERERDLADQVSRYKVLATKGEPANSQANLDAAKANLKNLSEQFQRYVDELEKGADGESITAGLPKNSLQSLFQMREMQDALKIRFAERAKETRLINIEKPDRDRPRVILREKAQAFGFDYFINERQDGPTKPEEIRAAHIQRQVINYLVDKLLGALEIGVDDLALEEVLRSPVVESANPVTGTFQIDPRVSARVPGIVDTYAFQLRFVARTKTLRRFLNEVAAHDLPLIVRSVEAERFTADLYTIDPNRQEVASPFGGADAPFPDAAAPAGSAFGGPAEPAQAENKPIVERTLTRIIVTLEYVEVLDSPEILGGGDEEGEGEDGSEDADEA